MRNPQFHDYLTRNDGLATRLRNARGDMLAKDLAAQAKWLATKVSKIESGKQLPSVDDLNTWAAITGIKEPLLGQLHAMLVEAQAFHTDYKNRMRNGQKAVQQEYNDLAETTTSFRFFEMAGIPRYLQLPQYTRALLQEMHDQHGSVDDVDEATAARQESVSYLHQLHRRFEFIIEEPVLRRRRLPPSVMRSQLFHLGTAIGLPNVRLGIYPSLSRQVRWTPQNSFELFDDVGYVETFATDGPRLLADEVAKYDVVMARLWEDAVEGDEARQLILDAIADLPAE